MKIFSSFHEISQALKNRETTCYQAVKDYLKVIEKKNKRINAFIEVYAEESLKNAKIIDKKIQANNAGKLAGMIISIKDNICFQDHKVTASSKILDGFESLYSATAVDRLLKEDAIIIGRLNCDEFAMGSSNQNSIYGPVRNPINPEKVPGGSSGGAAAAVSSGMCLAALGSDTGGSIRQPSSFCGVVGLKPTYSRVSRYGLIAYASSFDQIGPITNTVEDAALILEVISGKDPYDSTSSSRNVEAYSEIKKQQGKKKIGVIKECLEMKGLDLEIRKKTEDIILKIRKNGHEVEYISFPYLDFMVPIYYVLTTAEASSNLSRFDGVHYGYRSEKSSSLEETYINSRTEGFGEEVKRRIMLGTFVLSSGYHDAYYKKAQKIRRVVYNKTEELLKNYDFLLTPTTPHTAFDLSKEDLDPTKAYLEDIFTVHANITGNPAISLPIENHSNGLPIGIQIMSKRFYEKQLLSFSSQIVDLLKN